MNQYNFAERLHWSSGQSRQRSIRDILLPNIPGGIDVTVSSEHEDRNGTDYWIRRISPLRALSVDAKIRSLDPIVEYGKDDLALETWSVIEQSKIGWTRNPNKQTDYIFWLFVATNRWVLIPFPMLCQIFSEKWEAWKCIFRVATQSSGSWHSECVFVDRKTIWRELFLKYGGNL